ARSANLLWTAFWKQHGRQSSEVLGAHAFCFWIHHAGYRQLGARRGFCWRICCIETIRSSKPERLDHLIMALVCLVVTGLPILFSIGQGLPFLKPLPQ